MFMLSMFMGYNITEKNGHISNIEIVTIQSLLHLNDFIHTYKFMYFTIEADVMLLKIISKVT